MQAIIPKLAALAAALLAIWAIYRAGYNSCEEAHLIAAQKQEIAAREKEKEHDKNTYRVAEIYSADSVRLQRALDRLRNRPPSPPVSGTTDSPSPVDGIDGQRERACEGTEFYDRAMSCELKLKGFRDFVILQGLPVR